MTNLKRRRLLTLLKEIRDALAGAIEDILRDDDEPPVECHLACDDPELADEAARRREDSQP